MLWLSSFWFAWLCGVHTVGVDFLIYYCAPLESIHSPLFFACLRRLVVYVWMWWFIQWQQVVRSIVTRFDDVSRNCKFDTVWYSSLGKIWRALLARTNQKSVRGVRGWARLKTDWWLYKRVFDDAARSDACESENRMVLLCLPEVRRRGLNLINLVWESLRRSSIFS